MASGDLIKLAHLIFRTDDFQADETTNYGTPRKRRAVQWLPVDEAMEDGGWKVYSYENHRGASIDSIEAVDLYELEQHIEKYFGVTWRYQLPPD